MTARSTAKDAPWVAEMLGRRYRGVTILVWSDSALLWRWQSIDRAGKRTYRTLAAAQRAAERAVDLALTKEKSK